ncbi:hypothetical protein [Mongoliibacter ruber]|uniref:Glycosyltransferase involved in cell wall biosynthesis n=1 Tax=Mongoliibacter ruber TaxID=1750599 RepID=A0A2T0WWA9_9BACT|nr:hypothetical protein [Mongoliibacter ruber]PRY90969.1 glycosyltransferase involved in cell wall biosynthesis [Mongoliibacter ruber]
MKKLLFISWDSTESNYLESLFFPILHGLQQRQFIEAHVMQFSWASASEVKRIKSLAKELGIEYIHHPVKRKPFESLGALEAVYKGVFWIKNYVEEHHIEILMPRSTMPATMVNRLWDWLRKNGVKVVFDADGFPLQERVDFVGMKKSSLSYRLLYGEEGKMLERADRILVRSQMAKTAHSERLIGSQKDKIHVVCNGRDSQIFWRDSHVRVLLRKELAIKENKLLWVYTGTIGPQYRVEDMLQLFYSFWEKEQESKLLVLSRSRKLDLTSYPDSFKEAVIQKQVPFKEIPAYLSAADLGLSLRKPAPSISGLAPIKTGEYLMMGLPVIVSSGIGDTDQILKDQPFAFFWEKGEEENLQAWLSNIPKQDPEMIREFALDHFSLSKSLEDYMKAI